MTKINTQIEITTSACMFVHIHTYTYIYILKVSVFTYRAQMNHPLLLVNTVSPFIPLNKWFVEWLIREISLGA